MFYTGTHHPIELHQIPDSLLAFYQRMKAFESPCEIVIGTDSQNFSYTKMVSVIAMFCHGHGGIFFYRISREQKIKNVKQKLQKETGDSLELAYQLIELLEGKEKYEEMYLSCPLSIHIDAGNSVNGKTKGLIPELVGWVKGCGFTCKFKPESPIASSVADKISK